MKPLNIPYVPSPDRSSCALACHAMVANYFVPGTSIADVAQIVGWQKGFVVWPFRFWNWLMAHGVCISDIDLIHYEAWATRGIEGLRESIPRKEFDWYEAATIDLDRLSSDVATVIQNPGLTYRRRKPTWEDLQAACERGALCEVVLDSCTLDHLSGFELHRVLVVHMDDDAITFHDPRPEPESMPARHVSKAVFSSAWLNAVSAPELCVYEHNPVL